MPDRLPIVVTYNYQNDKAILAQQNFIKFIQTCSPSNFSSEQIGQIILQFNLVTIPEKKISYW